jgi:hypothetical protein
MYSVLEVKIREFLTSIRTISDEWRDSGSSRIAPNKKVSDARGLAG